MKTKKEWEDFVKDQILEYLVAVAIQFFIALLLDNLNWSNALLIIGTTAVFVLALRVYPELNWYGSAILVVIAYTLAASFLDVFPPLNEVELTELESRIIPGSGPFPIFYKACKGFIITYGWLNFIIALGAAMMISEEMDQKNKTKKSHY